MQRRSKNKKQISPSKGTTRTTEKAL